MSTKNYDARLLELWRDGGGPGIELKLDSEATSVKLRQKLYQLRKAMAKEKHEWYELAARATISLVYLTDDGKENLYRDHKSLYGKQITAWLLRISASDLNLDKVLEEAGYTVVKAPSLD